MNRRVRSIIGSLHFRNTESCRGSSFDGNIAGGSDRIDTDKYDKEDARDFALWKLVGEDEQPGWDAPFGRGRPGWHIECSAMSMKYLGETFDLHGGRYGPAVSASRERDRTERGCDRQAVFQILDPQRISEDRRRDDVEVEGQFLHFSRSARAGLFAACDTLSTAFGSISRSN